MDWYCTKITIELEEVCVRMGEGYSRSTYDGYGAGRIDKEGKVVDDGISLHCTMVWLSFFCGWSKKYQFLPRPTGQSLDGNFYRIPRNSSISSNFDHLLSGILSFSDVF